MSVGSYLEVSLISFLVSFVFGLGGLGSAVAEVLVENCPVPMERLGTPDVFGLSGKGWDLLHYFKLDENGIIEKVKKVLVRKR